MTRFSGGKAHKRDLSQTLFLNPFDVLIQESIKQKNVEGALMVGNKYIGLFGIKLLMS